MNLRGVDRKGIRMQLQKHQPVIQPDVYKVLDFYTICLIITDDDDGVNGGNDHFHLSSSGRLSKMAFRKSC